MLVLAGLQAASAAPAAAGGTAANSISLPQSLSELLLGQLPNQVMMEQLPAAPLQHLQAPEVLSRSTTYAAVQQLPPQLQPVLDVYARASTSTPMLQHAQPTVHGHAAGNAVHCMPGNEATSSGGLMAAACVWLPGHVNPVQVMTPASAADSNAELGNMLPVQGLLADLAQLPLPVHAGDGELQDLYSLADADGHWS